MDKKDSVIERNEYVYGFYRETTPGIDILKGACDPHVHTGPAVFKRLLTHFEAAEQAQTAGMRAIVLKDHHSETASKAEMVRSCVPGIETYGGVVLNYAVGGLNLNAVDTAINYGAKIIWMPTADALNHVNKFGREGATYGGYHTVASGRKLSYRGRRGITVLTVQGELVPEMEDILNMIAESNIALATSHLTSDEDTVLVEDAREAGVDKIIISHANYWLVELDLEKQIELVKKGAYLELVYSTLMPYDEKVGTLDQDVKTIKRAGAEHIILSSDLGQIINVPPVEGLRAFYASLMGKGISKEDLNTMACTNTSKLLNLR